jgi:hypothetical protein
LLHFDISASDLQNVSDVLQASEAQFRAALSVAARRTATTLRTLAARRFRDELALRAISMLRERLKSTRIKFGKDGGMQLWFGLNDMPVSWFKGSPTQDSAGASFRGHQFKGAFVAKSAVKGRKTIFKRTGKGRLHIAEQNLPVEDKARVIVEDEIFVMTEEIFWKFLNHEINARVKYDIGRK